VEGVAFDAVEHEHRPVEDARAAAGHLVEV
jgi:hypothetical protein